MNQRSVARCRGLLAGLLLAGTACRDATPATVWHEESGYRWRALAPPGGDETGFAAMDERRTGIRFGNRVSDSLLLGNRILAQGAGVALGDVDGDGLVDLFLARTEGPNALYRNRGDWRFEDVTAASGLAAPDRFSTGATFADIDGDGDLDLILLATTGPNAVFENDGGGRFTERTGDGGLDRIGRGGTTPALADIDGDGDLDLYVANYKPFFPADSIPPQLLAFNQIVRQTSRGFEVIPERARDFRIIMNPDGRSGFLSIRAEPDDFYLNENGRFRRESIASARFQDAEGRPLAEAPESFGLGARFADFNGDGAPDLYVANDFEGADEFWINDGAGRFRLADWTTQRQTSNSGMAVDVGDVNADGLPDLFEVDMLGNDTRRLKTQMPTHTAAPKTPGDLSSQPQLQRNTLFLNRGDGTFGEVSEYAGVEASGWSWSTLFLDVDLDGWQDILIGTGHSWDVMDADTQERLQNRLSAVPWQRARWEYPALPLRNVAFRNRGNLTWDDKSAEWNFGVDEDISHAMAAADLDGDGDLDLVINRLGAPVKLLRNRATAARVAIRLIGDRPNTRAVGAKITVRDGAVPVQVREVAAGGLYLSHSDYLASCATGAADSVTVIVDWRDGRRTTLPGVRPGREYEITTATATAPDPEPSPAGGAEAPLFEDVTAALAGHAHTETPFDDWERQFLLPNALSQLGPGVAWFDVDRDGDEDLIVGAGAGGRLALFRNDGGRFRALPPTGPAAPDDYTSILGLADGGGTRVLAGLSNWEAKRPELVLDHPSVVAAGVGSGGLSVARGVVPPHPSATGPMALADVDRDGDLDLFVGGRVIPGRYPLPAASRLYRRDGAGYVEDSASTAAFAGLGLATAAVFADLDGDGDSDLVVATEWGPLRVFTNRDGVLAPAPALPGLDRWTSRWNGLATGDLDGDGRLDLVATSWGRNVVARPDSQRPLSLVYGRFGSRGEVEMLQARHDPRLGVLAPLNSYARVRATIPDLATRIRTFGAYADAGVDQVLAGFGGPVERLEAVTLDHMVFLNRGDRFEAVPLPVEAQLAPAFHTSVADFNGDGFEDVFLSQNFFPTEIGTPRYDTGRGLLLLGDGRGGLTAVPGQRSGIIVYGDQRGAAHADFDRDGRLDLVVTQNASTTRLFRNQGGRPGLRVRVAGGRDNPDGIGVQLRLGYGDRDGPVREVQAGSGYWSQNGAVQVLGLEGTPVDVWVRWPGGAELRVPVPAGSREITVRRPAGSLGTNGAQRVDPGGPAGR